MAQKKAKKKKKQIISFQENPYLQALVCFVLALLPRLVISLQALPMRTQSDEVATLSAAAYFAGYDWSEVIQNAGYYGTGFFGLFFWVFKLFDDPVLIYRTVLCFCAIAQALTAVICYIILRSFFRIRDTGFLCIVSILCSFCVATRTTITYNEHPLILLSWLYALCLLLQFHYRHTRKQALYSFLALFILGYGYTIHIRFLIVAIATCVAWVIFYLLCRESLFHPLCVPAGLAFYFPAKLYVQFIQGRLWRLEAGESIRNSEISLSVSTNLLSWNTLRGWIKIVLGQLTTMNVAMMGLFVLSIVLFFVYLWPLFKKAWKEKRRTYSDEDKYLIILFSVFLCCIGGTILAQSLSWLDGVVAGVAEYTNDSTYYAYKAFTYIRYAAPYVGPLILTGFVICYLRRELVQKSLLISLGITGALSLFFIRSILPYIKNNGNAVEAYIPWSMNWTIWELPTSKNYILSLLLILGVYLIGFILIRYKKFIPFLCLLVVLLESQFFTIAHNRDMIMQKNNFASAKATFTIVKEFSTDNDIYVYETKDKTNHQLFYPYQLYLSRYHIIPGLPLETQPETIVIANGDISNLLPDDLKEYQVGSEQFIYVGAAHVAQMDALTAK